MTPPGPAGGQKITVDLEFSGGVGVLPRVAGADRPRRAGGRRGAVGEGSERWLVKYDHHSQ